MGNSNLDPAALKKMGLVQQKQKEYFALRLRAVGGDFNVKQLRKVAEVAEKYAKGEVHLTTRQGIEIHNVHQTKIEEAKKELEKGGVFMGACGPRVRGIIACPGGTTCRWGIIDTKEIARELDAKYFLEETPHKFKFSVTGCPHNCAKATENDIGVMGAILPKWNMESCTNCDLCVSACPTQAIEKRTGNDGKVQYALLEDKCINCSICTSICPSDAWTIAFKGYNLFIGGTMGKVQRLATLLKKLLTREEAMSLIEKSLRYYQKNGRKKERFGITIDRIGTEEVVKGIADAK